MEPDEILRADGAKPSKHGYFEPSALWLLNRETGCKRVRRLSGRWYISYVELMDGRFCLNECAYRIRIDDGGWERADGRPRRNNFPSRTAAIRAAAARLILVMRGARRWQGNWDSLERWDDYACAVNSVLDLVDRETQSRRSKRRLIVGPTDLVEQLLEAGYSRGWIRRYIETNYPGADGSR